MTEKSRSEERDAQELRLLATARPALWKWGKRGFLECNPEAGLEELVIWTLE
jgi:hypothetical protein